MFVFFGTTVMFVWCMYRLYFTDTSKVVWVNTTEGMLFQLLAWCLIYFMVLQIADNSLGTQLFAPQTPVSDGESGN